MGGGLCDCDGKIHNNIIVNNEASGFGFRRGGGLFNCNGYILNNTIVGNSADYGGAFSNCDATVENCIVWGNSSDQINETPIVRYSDVQGGWTGLGNIDVDPLFVDSCDGDYHLKSEGWRWDAGGIDVVGIQFSDNCGCDGC